MQLRPSFCLLLGSILTALPVYSAPIDMEITERQVDSVVPRATETLASRDLFAFASGIDGLIGAVIAGKINTALNKTPAAAKPDAAKPDDAKPDAAAGDAKPDAAAAEPAPEAAAPDAEAGGEAAARRDLENPFRLFTRDSESSLFRREKDFFDTIQGVLGTLDFNSALPPGLGKSNSTSAAAPASKSQPAPTKAADPKANATPVSPEATPKPEVTAAPDASTKPDAAAKPDASPKPDASTASTEALEKPTTSSEVAASPTDGPDAGEGDAPAAGGSDGPSS